MMPTCRETTRLASEALDHPLTLWQRMQVAMHMAMCGPCRRMRRSMRFLRKVGKRLGLGEVETLPTEESLSPEARGRIKEVLQTEFPS